MEVEKLDKLYTVTEVTIMLNVKANSVRLWLNSGKLKGVKVGRHWRVKESHLNEFLKEHEGGKAE